MEANAHGKATPIVTPARRHRGFTIGETQDMHRFDHGAECLDERRNARIHRRNTYAEAHVQPRGTVGHDHDDQHDEKNQPELPQKMGLRQKIKAAKHVVKDTIQMGKETVGFIRELRKQFKELDDLEQENSMRPRAHQPWRPGKRRSSYYYDSD